MNKKEEKILNAAIKLFLDQGVKKTTMDDIAARANVSKVTIYKYFTDKDTLYLYAGKLIFSTYTEKLGGIIAGGGALNQKFAGFMDAIGAFAGSGLYALCGELAGYNEGVGESLKNYLEIYRHALFSLIDGGISAGLLKAGLDREIVFHYVDMGVEHYRQDAAYRERMLHDGAYRQKFMSFFIGNIFMNGADIGGKNEAP